ncbi:MAG: lamin tail domain-containing protein [Bacteroidota bacterium]
MVEATLYYSTDGTSFQAVPFLDNGLQGDDEAGDGTYGAMLPGVDVPSEIRYYLEVNDADGQLSRAPVCGEKKIAIAIETVQLVINEFMASNNSVYADEWGEFDDWIEIYNADNQSIFLGNLFLSDDPDNRSKWQMPPKTISPGQQMILWADDSPNQGQDHCNFKLKASGEYIGIYSSLETGLSVIDSLSYGEQVSDLSQGRLPNGSGPIQDLAIPSPGMNNETATSLKTVDGILNHRISPNPFQSSIALYFEIKNSTTACLNIRNAIGQLVQQKCFSDPTNQIEFEWDGRNQSGHLLAAGLYRVELILDEQRVMSTTVVFSP